MRADESGKKYLLLGSPPVDSRSLKRPRDYWGRVRVFLACRTGVIFCVFQGNRGKSEASAKRELRAWWGSLTFPRTQLALASPFAPSSPEIRKKSRLFCRLGFFPHLELPITFLSFGCFIGNFRFYIEQYFWTLDFCIINLRWIPRFVSLDYSLLIESYTATAELLRKELSGH